MPDVQTEVLAWVSAATAVAAAIGLPKIITDRRAKKAKETAPPGPKSVVPARPQLVDRVREIAELQRLVEAGEPVVIVEGGRGVGKSAVAIDLAHRIAEGVPGRRGKRRRPASVLYWFNAENDCLSLTDLCRKFALYCGDKALAMAPAAAKADVLNSYLATNPRIMVMDNLRLRPDQGAPLREFLRFLPAGSQAIVSANTVGVLDGPRVTLSELAPDDAWTLLTREAQRRNVSGLVDADKPLMDRVHRLVGGNPEAIRLLVTACASQPGTVTELLGEIEHGNGKIETYYTNIWPELHGQARAALSVCALLAAGADVGQVATALDAGEPDIRETLRQLWNNGLVETVEILDRMLYRCPAALRQFVLQRVEAGQLATAQKRLALSLVTWFTKNWEDAAGAATQIEAIRTLINNLANAGEDKLCLDLFAAVYDPLFTLGLFDDRIELGWVAFRAADALGSAEDQSLALSVISSTHAIRGEDAEAASAVRIGLAIARAAGLPREIARQLRCEAFRLYRAGRVEEALEVLRAEDAEGMARDAGDFNNMIDILSLISAAQFHLGDIDGCAATARRFHDACEQMPWERGKAYSLRHLAEVRLMRGDQPVAADMVAQAKAIATKHNDVREATRIGLTQARLHLFAGQMRLARDTAVETATAAQDLMLPGEHKEAEAVANQAVRCLRMPLRRRKVVNKPRNRFTEWTVGGD